MKSGGKGGSPGQEQGGRCAPLRPFDLQVGRVPIDAPLHLIHSKPLQTASVCHDYLSGIQIEFNGTVTLMSVGILAQNLSL